ncbi:MAG: hypothetical protein DMD31_01610 [Gemmatimonadetes bacterium]|nr:MAG: hypothetical protein DMD31_01610 [Gemmatimonadota bacterium]
MKLKATRRHERYSLTLDIELAHGRGLSSNVSAGGLYFVTDQPHSPGAPIEFTLVLGDLSPSVPCQLRCKGEILRVEPRGDQVGVAATIQSYSIESASL